MAHRSRPWGFRRIPTLLRRRARTGALIAVSMTLAGCRVPSFGAPKPASRQGGHILGLWQGTVIAAAVVGLFVWSLIIWSVVRYRKRSEVVPKQNAENIPIEVLYTFVPVAIISVLFFFTMRTQGKTDNVAKKPDVVINVIGFQWQWQFEYPAEGITVTGNSQNGRNGQDRGPQMVLPVGRTVQLNLRSADVNHSFWVPRFLSKRDLIPGVRNRINVDVTKPGTFVGRCAEFCGLDHWRMNFEVRAVSEANYRTWLDGQRGGQPQP